MELLKGYPNGTTNFQRIIIEALCGENLIDIGIALENENIRAALKENDAAKVEQILKTEF